MSKIIIIERCGECPCIRHHISGHRYICWETKKTISLDCVSDDCPFSDLPEKMLTWHDNEQDDYEMGWNACLDAIRGGKEE